MNSPNPAVFGQNPRVDAFKTGMRKLASGVALITSVTDGRRFGLIATAVSSVSASPPTLLVCVNQNASAHDAIDQSGCLCVNLLEHVLIDVNHPGLPDACDL